MRLTLFCNQISLNGVVMARLSPAMAPSVRAFLSVGSVHYSTILPTSSSSFSVNYKNQKKVTNTKKNGDCYHICPSISDPPLKELEHSSSMQLECSLTLSLYTFLICLCVTIIRQLYIVSAYHASCSELECSSTLRGSLILWPNTY